MGTQGEALEDFDPFAGPAILRTAPSTGSQREIWTASQLGPEASLCYNESITLRFDGAIDLDALAASFGQVVARHDALRSTISADGLTVLVGDSPADPAVVHDVSSRDADAREAAFARLLAAEVETPFDLTVGPLFRLHLVRFAADHVRAVLTAHHIVFDGWSTAVLIEEWAGFYTAALERERLGPDSPPSFCDYALAEFEYLESAQHDADLEYWLDQFAGALPTLDLPVDRHRPRQRTFAARRVDTTLPADLVDAIRAVGAAEGASLFTTLLAGFDALLHRLSGQEDLVVGIPAAGQAIGGWDNLIGHGVNVLPLRAAVTGDTTFAELVSSVRTTMLDAYDHQRLTFGSLVAELPVARDPARPPLVSVIFNVDRSLAAAAMGFGSARVELRTNERHYENFDLFLNAVESPDGLVLECQYNQSLFDETTIRRWLAAYERLLAGVAVEPSLTLSALPLISEDERAQIDAWNDAAAVDHPDDTFVSLFASRVVEQPDDPAVRFDGNELTYRELDVRAEAVARVLRVAGVGPGRLVGLSVERSERMLVGLVGIAKTGAGYVPLDPGFPRDRLDHMVSQSNLAALVTETDTHAELELAAPTVVLLDDESLLAAGGAEPQAAISPDPDDPAYVIFTSGSTGRPKGVQVPHRALANLLHSVARAPGMTADDTVLAVTTLSFDIAVSELLLPLTVGATIALASREVASDGGQLLALLESSGATFIDATPATYRLLFAAGFVGDPELKVICTGEAMPMELGQRLVGCVGELWNGYGPSETTVWSSFHRVRPDADRVLIGFPVDNTRLYVLDDHLQPVPIGVAGELYIAGRGLSDGYVGRPDLTAERFVADPFVPGERMYRSGDLARYLPDGQLECLGRNDHQVKVRGYRIELGEIEHVLDRHDSISQSVVTVREDTPGDPRLVGYVLAGESADIADTELRDHLSASLPDYMLPRTFVRVDGFPLTPSGKVDRAALPAPDPTMFERSAAIIAPRTESESIVAALFQEALAVPRVSVDDDFFELGGHSLLASQVLARLRNDHDVVLSFRVIFEAPTVKALAARVDALRADEAGSAPPRLERRAESGDVDLSTSQERLWLLEQMDPSQRLVHHLPAAWRVRGPVDLAALQRALDALARRHDMLRTRLVSDDGTVRQRIEPAVSLPIESIDLRAVPQERREAELSRLMNERTRAPFDLFELPLHRACLVRLDEEEFVLHTVRHNLIWDGWSFDIFLDELTTLYGAFARGEASPLPELSATYADYVGFQQSFLESERVARQVDFWQQRLAGDPPEATLPPDRARPATSTHAGANLVAHLGGDRARALTDLGRANGSTLYMVVLAAFAVMLHRQSQERDLLIGTPVRARQLPELEGIIGPFINAVVLRTGLEPDMTFLDLLDHVRDVTLDAFSNEDMPLERLGTRPPVVRTFFSFQDARSRPPALGDATVEQLHAEPPAAANDLMMWMMETPTDLLAVANYSTELYDRATIEGFLEGFEQLLDAVVADPSQSLENLPVGAIGSTITGRGPVVPDPLAPALTAAENADGATIADGDAAVTVGELLRRAGGLAVALEAGSGLVAVRAQSAIDRAAAVLASLGAGRPLTVTPADAPSGLVLEQAIAGGATTVVIDPEIEVEASVEVVRIAGEASVFAPAVTSSDDLAWYPNDGRAVSREHLATLGAALADALALSPRVQIGWVLPPGSDLEVLLTVAALCAGSSISVLGARDRIDRSDRPDLDILVAAPAQLARYRNEELARVGHVIVAGTPTVDLLEKIWATGTPVSRLQLISKTEPVLLFGDLEEAGLANVAGAPLAPAAALIADHGAAPASIGAQGRLLVASRAALDEGSPMVDTGVTGRLRSDGQLEHHGPPPGRVEVGGRTVAAATIEECLMTHPAVGRAHVVQTPSSGGSVRLTAYLDLVPAAAFTATELRRHVRDRLPESLTPTRFVEVTGWPTRADGTLDVARFADADEEGHVEARTDTERLLAELWGEGLGIDRVGVHDNFFALGGHSLLCFRILDQVEQRTGVRLSPRVMLLGSLEQTALELDDVAGGAVQNGSS